MLPIYDGKLIPSPANHSLLGRLRFDASNLTVSEITSLSGFTPLKLKTSSQYQKFPFFVFTNIINIIQIINKSFKIKEPWEKVKLLVDKLLFNTADKVLLG